MYIYIYIYIDIHRHPYIYIYIERERDIHTRPASFVVTYMRNLLGWLETGLAQNTLIYIKLCSITLNNSTAASCQLYSNSEALKWVS